MSWSNLPTNYSDATWEGSRKYTITLVDDQQRQQQFSNSTIVDTTQYNPTTSGGNMFYGALDANQTNDAINKIVAALGSDINNLKVNISNGGTGATTALAALQNLGISQVGTIGFNDNTRQSYINSMLSYVSQNIQPYRPFVFNAVWAMHGYGSGVAFETENIRTVIVHQEEIGFCVFRQTDYGSGWTTWYEESTNKGVVIYDNSSGSNGTINLSESVANYRHIEVQYKDGDDNYYVYKVFEPNGKQANFMSADSNEYGVFEKRSELHFDGTSIWHFYNYQVNNPVGSNWSIESKNDIYITKIIGYK